MALKRPRSNRLRPLVSLLLFAAIVGRVSSVEFEESEISVSEDVGTESVTLQRGSADSAITVTVGIMTLEQFSQRDTGVQGSCQMSLADIGVADLAAVDAAEVSDFTAGDVTVEFAAGELTASLIIEIVEDQIAEAGENFVAVISAPHGEGRCALLVTLVDNDAVSFGFSATELSTPVADSGTFEELMLLKIGSNERDLNITIQVISGTATRDEDYTLTVTSFIFTSEISSFVVPIGLMDDDIGENVENFVVCLPATIEVEDTQVTIPVDQRCCTVQLIDDDTTILGYVDQSDSHPIYTLVEGSGLMDNAVCIGITGGNLNPTRFFEMAITLQPDSTGIDDRLTVSRFDFNMGSTPGPTRTIIQLAQALPADCFDLTAVQNGVVDGNVYFSMQLSTTGTTDVNEDLVIAVAFPNATIEVLDDDFNTFTIALGGGAGSGPVVIEEDSSDVIGPIVITRAGPPTTLTYILTLGSSQDPNTVDFDFEPIILDPSMESFSFTVGVTNDLIPEPTDQYDIVIERVEMADGREGVAPTLSGSIPVQVLDNDFLVGFPMPEPTVTLEETADETTLDLSILELDPATINAQASLPFTLTLQREGDSQGPVNVALETTEIVLDAANPSDPVRLVISDDEECSGPQRYTLTYTYTGSEEFTVDTTGSITIEITDDDCITLPPDSSTMSTSATTTGDGDGDKQEGGSTCVACIVVPIIIVLIVLPCLLLLLLLIICLCCCDKWWHTYDARKREAKFGPTRLE